MNVKICGITRLEDALAAVRHGADALGFNFWPGSKRYVAPADAARIVGKLPPGVLAFGVFVNASREELLASIAASGVGVAQLHGDEPPGLCALLPVPVVKAIRVDGPGALAAMAAYDVSAFLLDAPGPGFGGSGRTLDWALAAEAARAARVYLAGGLTPENVGEAVRRVRPFGVDVASGVELLPGVKDEEKMQRFIQAAKEAAR
ncbi:MAG TPA: phosphoribosylanthranilate isomerase [Anaeromyxobacter sp.]|nr:phosphoribosylanthranilate isomerase [Anaeromyxobacter sp.]